MPILLPTFFAPRGSQVGLGAILRASGKLIQPVAFAAGRRPLSTSRFSSQQPCTPYSSCRGLLGPYSALYNSQSRRLLPRTTIRTFLRFRATTQYIDLPKDYEDAKGLPFRREDLNQREVNMLFGTLSARDANSLMRIMHGRRVAGTLDDPILARNTKQYKPIDVQRALKYLREHIPVDEVLNAGLRAEDELKALEAEESAVQEDDDKTPTVPTGRLPKRPGDDSPYGESSLDRLRAENIAKREAEEARIEEERKKREEETAVGELGTLQTHVKKDREMSPWVQKFHNAATSQLESPPEMTTWERLFPSAVMTLLVIAGCIAYAMMYQAPPQSKRRWPDIPPAAATVLGLMMVNALFALLWRIPPAWAIMNRYAIIVAATPKPLQLIGAVFSHQKLGHLALNMAFLWFFGTRVHDEIGRGNFLALYMSSGVVAFMCSLTNLVLNNRLAYTSLGASGAIYGIIAAFFWQHRFDEFKILGFPPDPISGPQGLGFLGLILGTQILPLLSKKSRYYHNIDIASHIGGMAAGVVGIEAIRMHMEEQARKRAEKRALLINLRQKAEDEERGRQEKEQAAAATASTKSKWR